MPCRGIVDVPLPADTVPVIERGAETKSVTFALTSPIRSNRIHRVSNGSRSKSSQNWCPVCDEHHVEPASLGASSAASSVCD
jgi:hypothetical protein